MGETADVSSGDRHEAIAAAIDQLLDRALADPRYRPAIVALAELVLERAGEPVAMLQALASATAAVPASADEALEAESGPVTVEAAADGAATIEVDGNGTAEPRRRRAGRDGDIVPMDRAAFLALVERASRSIEDEGRGTLAELLLGPADEPALDLDREAVRFDEPDDPDAKLPGIVTRCRLRAAVARDVAARARFGTPIDEDHLHRARSEGAAVWMADLIDPDADAVDRLSESLDAVADTAELIVLLRTFEPTDRVRRAEAVRLLAAVQSSLRFAASDLRQAPDDDQVATFDWLKATTERERIFIERHMRLQDPLDPARLPEVLETVHESLGTLQARAERQERLKKTYQKLKYLGRQLGQGRGAAGDSDKLVAAVDTLVEDGIPPSSLRFRDALFGALDQLPGPEGRSAAYGRVIRELELHRDRVASQPVAAPAADEVEDDPADEIVRSIASPAAAVEQARIHLDRVAIPASATESLGVFEGVPTAAAWGRSIWRGLRALHAYAGDAHESAGFWNWCETSGSPVAWPATPRRLAMTESDGVQNEHLETRRFGVDPAVDPSGEVVMLAHLKIGSGGTILPRVYFHDDTKGATGRVHVGFIGPHTEVPNGLTN